MRKKATKPSIFIPLVLVLTMSIAGTVFAMPKTETTTTTTSKGEMVQEAIWTNSLPDPETLEEPIRLEATPIIMDKSADEVSEEESGTKVTDTVDYTEAEAEESPQEVEETSTTEEEPEDDNSWSAEFTVTAYCGCYECSEGYGNMTSTGVQASEGRTIAVDPEVVPYGSVVIINGQEYIAEDCGGAINGYDIDVFYEDHDEATAFGVQYIKCTVYEQ